ncbi:MAG: NAD-dependent epimerase/dehydratase family protein [Deltaproteobacteria bacterium]|nr:NAD-dependent epimerase/dehydratase family protein [Deltaproteobacteria bacterium]
MSQLSVVTGGGGFVGRHLVNALLERGDRVRVLDIVEPTGLGGEFVKTDITDPNAVRAGLEGADLVFHNASLVHTKQNKADFVWNVNYEGTRHIIEGCQELGIGKLVYVSSGSVVYDGEDIENGDESLPYATKNLAPYAHSKVEAEKLVLARNGERGLATTALRPHVVFGVHDTRFLPALIAHAKAGRLRFQVGRRTWLSDYTYVSNLVDALLAAGDRLELGSAVAGNAYFITNGEPMPFWEFVRRVLERLGLPPLRGRIPHQLVYAIAAVKEGIDTLRGGTISPEDGLTRFAIRYMCTHHYFSIDKARRDLGYDPAVSIDEGIERTCQHLLASGAV